MRERAMSYILRRVIMDQRPVVPVSIHNVKKGQSSAKILDDRRIDVYDTDDIFYTGGSYRGDVEEQIVVVHGTYSEPNGDHVLMLDNTATVAFTKYILESKLKGVI